MSLFQNSVLKKYLSNQKPKEIAAAFETNAAYFHNLERQENIRNSKEEQFQEGFFARAFCKYSGLHHQPKSKFQPHHRA